MTKKTIRKPFLREYRYQNDVLGVPVIGVLDENDQVIEVPIHELLCKAIFDYNPEVDDIVFRNGISTDLSLYNLVILPKNRGEVAKKLQDEKNKRIDKILAKAEKARKKRIAEEEKAAKAIPEGEATWK